MVYETGSLVGVWFFHWSFWLWVVQNRPEAEQKAAKAAMDAAMSAGADKYAAADFDAAKKKWEGAEAQMKDKKYKEAKQAYNRLPRPALKKLPRAWRRERRLLQSRQPLRWQPLRGHGRIWKPRQKRWKRSMKDKKDAWMADAKAISEGMAKAKEMVASDPVGAKAKLDELKAMVDKWEGALKEMAAAPAPAKAEPAKKREKIIRFIP